MFYSTLLRFGRLYLPSLMMVWSSMTVEYPHAPASMTKNRNTRTRIAFNWGSHLSSASDYEPVSNGNVLLL